MMKLNEFQLNRLELKNMEHSDNYTKMKIGVPACLHHDHENFGCAINCVNTLCTQCEILQHIFKKICFISINSINNKKY